MFNRVRSFSFPSSSLGSDAPEDFIPSELPLELREAWESWQHSDLTPDNYARSVNESDWPVSIYVPERYEDGYAYPLITWFHSDANDEEQLESVMKAVSSQNYIGLALRGNHEMSSATGGFRWDPSTTGMAPGRIPLQQLLHLTVCRLRRTVHIHSERIFLAGSGHGADTAMQMLAFQPDWFAGAVLLDPFCEAAALPEDLSPALQQKPILMSLSGNCGLEVLGRSVRSVRRLRSAGAVVDVDFTELPVDPGSSEARRIDHWIMDRVAREAFV
ncbi:MAG: alpha/beta hydrolase [Planctomycetaceae bacterium]|jgi:phospholipase/carboxylesterase